MDRIAQHYQLGGGYFLFGGIQTGLDHLGRLQIVCIEANGFGKDVRSVLACAVNRNLKAGSGLDYLRSG